jgi:streptogrisin C
LAIASLAGGAGLFAAPAQAAEAMPAPTGKPIRAEDAKGSIAYLRAAYGVDESEAIRRLELQRISVQVQEWLRTNHSDTFGGMWIDQEGGGLLNLASTTPAVVERVTANLPDRKHVRAPKVRWSLSQLEATQARLEKSINPGLDIKLRRAEVSVDVPANVVAVYQRAGAVNATTAGASGLRKLEQQPLVADAGINAMAQAEGGRAVVRQLTVGEEKSGGLPLLDPPVDPDLCAPAACGPPMRGGMRLNVNRTKAKPVWPANDNLNAMWGECTNGFNMTDQRGWNYIMTAGHCMVGPYNLGINRTYSKSGTPVSTEVHNFENGCSGSSCGSTYPYDYSIQPYSQVNYQGSNYNYYDYWSAPYPKNRVVSYCWWSSSTWGGCQDGSYQIRGLYSYSTPGVGWIVCGTGSGDDDPASGYHRNSSYIAGTRCGKITAMNDGGYRTDICTRQGDSGGPLFSEIDSMAYGILSHGYTGTGACPSPPSSQEYSNYTPIDKIIKHVNDQTVRLENVYYGFSLTVNP